ncbi:hypothetical protein L9F63_021959 [Diploptera punctata]|uniref:Uncharacterized protein n=1 Tax=Diploptera punctata TaxID=6984 RepID=A0AAD7ZNE2_DIPPU|nr:hypothetical protein L9F63_021959 [Diploptera punctata]
MHSAMFRVLLTFALCFLLSSKKVIAESQEDEVEEKCKQEFGVDDSIFVDSRSEGDEDEEAFEEFDVTLKDENNENHRCFIQCLMEGYGYVKHGVLNVDFIVEEVLIELEEEGIKVDERELRRDIKFCARQEAEGKCNNTYQMVKCLFNLQKKKRR